MQRPIYHFTPPSSWMNDPNGLVYHMGTYHMFYQYYPDSLVWGPMHWGHATSTDLIKWTHQPIALYPDDLGWIFSGSIILDNCNSSRLFTDDNGLIAYFTYHKDKVETQSLAFSHDNGISWNKLNRSILSDKHLIDFRDPKVIPYNDKWIMVLACGNHIRFYQSVDLFNWQITSEFSNFKIEIQTPLECPDFFKCTVENETYEKWILKVDIANHPSGGPGAIYLVGDFDGTRFKVDENQNVKYFDIGQDFYAAMTWRNHEANTIIGWMNNWKYANDIPHIGYRGMMSIPRHLSLHYRDNQYILHQLPHKNILKHIVKTSNIHPNSRQNVNGPLLIQLNKIDSNWFSLLIGFKDKHLSIYIDHRKKLIIDRSNAIGVFNNPCFNKIVDIDILDTLDNMTILIDTNSIELFSNQGAVVVSSLHFCFTLPDSIYIQSDSLFIETIVHELEHF